MRKALLPLLVLSAYVTAGSASQTNLVNNPGFEQSSASPDRIAGGWWIYQGTGETTASVDAGNGHSGKASLKFQAAAPAKSVLVSAPFPVTAGDDLRFEVWARAEKPQTVQAGIAFRDADNKVFKRSYFS